MGYRYPGAGGAGVRQLALLWTPADGPEAEFNASVKEQFIGDPALRRQTFARIQDNMELIHGQFHQIRAACRSA